MDRIFCRTVCALVAPALLLLPGATIARAAILDGLGAIGAGSSRPNATTYPGLLQTHRGLNFGGAGFPYAFGQIGADSASVLAANNQIDMLVTEITAGNITLANFFIGNNDYIDVGNDIATGALTGGPLAAHQQQVAANIAAGVNAARNAGAGVVLGGLSNIVHSPAAASIKANPTARALFETALSDGNDLIHAFANSEGIPFINFFDLLSEVYGNGSAQMGGVELVLDGFSTDPHYFWETAFQPGIIVRGAIANLFIQAINDGYGTNVPLLSDLEILTLAGLEGEYAAETFGAAYAYPSFVTVPEPSGILLAGIGVALVAGCGWSRAARRRVPPRRQVC